MNYRHNIIINLFNSKNGFTVYIKIKKPLIITNQGLFTELSDRFIKSIHVQQYRYVI